jgi:hypothetical protein
VDGLDEGEYVVLFLEQDHAPAFYPSASTWTQATEITVTSDVSGIDGLLGGLNRPVGAQRSGMAQLRGVARTDAGVPLPGTLVTARSVDGEIVGYALTDSQGGYSLDAMPSRFMTVQADAPRYGVRGAAIELSGEGGFYNVTLSSLLPVSNEAETAASSSVQILRLAPNPTSRTARVQIEVGASGPARLAVFDVLGREVAVLSDGPLGAGVYDSELDASRLAPGVYVIRLQTSSGVATRQLTVVR